MAFDLGTAIGTVRLRYDGSSSVKQAQRDVTTLKGLIDATGVSGRNLNKIIGFGIAGAAVAGLAVAVKHAADFEKQLSAIEAVSGATGEEMDKLRDKALQLGADTVFSASEAANAMEELVKAGLSVDEVLNGAADAAVALAAASGIEIPEAAALAANVLNAFELQASDLIGVVDTLAGAANASAVDMNDLSFSLKQVGAVAHLVGLSVDDTVTAIGLLGNAGIRGSDAGTSLKTTLQSLIPVTTREVDKFKELNLLTDDGANKFFTAAGEVKNLAQVSQILQDALKNQTKEQQLSTLQTIFGSDALRAAAIIASNGAKGVHEFNKEMHDTTAAEVAAKRMDNLGGSVEQLSGSLDTFLIIVGSGLLIPLRALVDVLTAGTNAVTDIATEVGDHAAPGFEALGVAVQNVAEFLASAWDAAGPLVDLAATIGIGGLILLFNTLAQVLAFVTGLLKDTGDEAVALGAALLIMQAGGITAVASAITGSLIGALDLLRIRLGLAGLSAQGAAANLKAFSTVAAGLKTLGIAAVLLTLMNTWSDYQQLQADVKQAQEATNEAIADGSVSALKNANSQLTGQIDDIVAQYGRLGDANSLTRLKAAANPFNWDDIFNIGAANDAGASIIAEQQRIDDAIASTVFAVNRFEGTLGGFDSSAWTAMIEGIDAGDPKAIEEFDAKLSAMDSTLQTVGSSSDEFIAKWKIGGSTFQDYFSDIIVQLNILNTDAGRTASASDALTEAFLGVDDASQDAADSASALQDALDSLIGKEVSAQEAAIAFRDDLRDLKNQIDKNSKAIFGTSAAADTNKKAIDGLVDGLVQQIGAQADAGVGAERLALNLRKGRQDIINQAHSLGFGRKELNKYLDTLNLTPDQIDTIIQAVGATTAKEQMEALQAQYDLTDKQVKTIIEAAGADTAKEQVKALVDYINRLHDKTITITTINATAAGQQAAHSLNEADGDVLAMRRGGYGPGIYNGTRIKFAEAGPEAYIPMRRDKRRRSEMLLAQVARAFGGAFVKSARDGFLHMADGGVSNGGWDMPSGTVASSTVINRKVEITTVNPKKERTSDSVLRAGQRIQSMGLLDGDED